MYVSRAANCPRKECTVDRGEIRGKVMGLDPGNVVRREQHCASRQLS